MVWWVGPDLVPNVSDCAPLPLCLRHQGMQWLPLPEDARRYSTLHRAPSAPGQDHELALLRMPVRNVHVHMCRASLRRGRPGSAVASLPWVRCGGA